MAFRVCRSQRCSSVCQSYRRERRSPVRLREAKLTSQGTEIPHISKLLPFLSSSQPLQTTKYLSELSLSVAMVRRSQRSGRDTSIKAAPSKPLTGFGSGISLQDVGGLSGPSRNVVDPDSVAPAEELRKVRKTKIVSTIGPTSCSRDNLFRLANEVGRVCFQNLPSSPLF